MNIPVSYIEVVRPVLQDFLWLSGEEGLSTVCRSSVMQAEPYQQVSLYVTYPEHHHVLHLVFADSTKTPYTVWTSQIMNGRLPVSANKRLMLFGKIQNYV